MAPDLSRLIGAVTREISSREHDGMPLRVLVATRGYDTSIDDLWDALTDRERLPRWFLPISGDLRPGGRYQLEGNAGGQILRCEPPKRLDVTWEMHGQVSWVNVALTSASPTRTELRLEHLAMVPDEMWNQFGPGAVGVGWDLSLMGLERHFTSGGAVDPKTAMAWLGSDEGKRFVRATSDAWGEASIAAGTDAAAARAGAARTTAAYTGG